MPLYYFDIVDHDTTIGDEDGTNLKDAASALRLGEVILREIVSNRIRDARPVPRSIDVRDTGGALLASLPARSLFPEDF